LAIPESRRLTFTEVPVIEVGGLMRGNDDAKTIESIRSACADVGFLYVSGHGVPGSIVQSLVDAAGDFFQQPTDNKMRVALDKRMRGYLPLYYRSYEGEARAATSHQEGFWMGHERPFNPQAPLEGPNVWPEAQPGLKRAMLEYFAAIDPLRLTLQRAFALALGLAPQTFDHLFDHSLSRLKLNHYPTQRDDITEHNLGVVPHSDSGGFTILWQDDNGGLEIQSKNGDWVGAPPIADTMVVNLGQIMQLWTNGEFSATPHRVINRNNVDRYSIPLFVNPNSDAIIRPLTGDLDSFSPFEYGEYQRQSWQRSFPVANIP